MAEGTGFEVKISQTGGGEIYIDSNNITSVEFLIDTINENVKDRSENIVNKVIIVGEISEEIKAATKDLLLWSLAKNKEDIYRSAEITIRINETTRVRKYTMDNVFCLGYKEKFNNDGKDSTYELMLSQRKDNLGGIKAIC